MQDLIDQYKQTLELTKKEIKNIKCFPSRYKNAETYYTMLKNAERSIKYAIGCMEHGDGRRMTDISRYAVEKRTVVATKMVEQKQYEKWLTPDDEQQIGFEEQFLDNLRGILSSRRLDMLKMRASGHSIRYIAQALEINAGNVHRELQVIYSKIRTLIYEQDKEFAVDEDVHRAIDDFIEKRDKEILVNYVRDRVTNKQFEIFELYVNGHSQTDIKTMLNISDSYVAKIIKKCRGVAEEKGWAI